MDITRRRAALLRVIFAALAAPACSTAGHAGGSADAGGGDGAPTAATCASATEPVPLAVTCTDPRVGTTDAGPLRVSGVVAEWGTGLDGCLAGLEDYASRTGVPASAFHLLRI